MQKVVRQEALIKLHKTSYNTRTKSCNPKLDEKIEKEPCRSNKMCDKSHDQNSNKRSSKTETKIATNSTRRGKLERSERTKDCTTIAVSTWPMRCLKICTAKGAMKPLLGPRQKVQQKWRDIIPKMPGWKVLQMVHTIALGMEPQKHTKKHDEMHDKKTTVKRDEKCDWKCTETLSILSRTSLAGHVVLLISARNDMTNVLWKVPRQNEALHRADYMSQSGWSTEATVLP